MSGNSGLLPRVSLTLAIVGVALIFLSAGADLLGLDLTPGVGLMQTLGVLLGITFLVTAGFSFLAQRRPRDETTPLMSDIGIRMGLTGLLACYVSGLADMVGVGSHQGVRFDRPFLGPLQLIGFGLGLLVVLIGLILFWVGLVQGDPDSET